MVSFVGSFVWLILDTSAIANVWFNSDFILLSEFSYTYLHQASKHQQQIHVKTRPQKLDPISAQISTLAFIFLCFVLSFYPHFHLVCFFYSFLPVTFFYLLLFSTTLLLFSCYFFLGQNCYFFSCFFISIQTVAFFPVIFFLLLFSFTKLLLFSCYLFSCYFLSEHPLIRLYTDITNFIEFMKICQLKKNQKQLMHQLHDIANILDK